jgi:hypothetical protein
VENPIMRFHGRLLAAAVLLAVTATVAVKAEELRLDPSALDPNAGSAARPKAKKGAKAKAEAAAKPAKPAKAGSDRQFGELEGWSPGKTPPKEKKDETPSGEASKAPVSLSPTGNMSVGLPF